MDLEKIILSSLRVVRFWIIPIIAVVVTLLLPAYHVASYIVCAVAFIGTIEGGPCRFSMVRPFILLCVELAVFGLKINGIL